MKKQLPRPNGTARPRSHSVSPIALASRRPGPQPVSPPTLTEVGMCSDPTGAPVRVARRVLVLLPLALGSGNDCAWWSRSGVAYKQKPQRGPTARAPLQRAAQLHQTW
jgi:hypothetical protein